MKYSPVLAAALLLFCQVSAQANPPNRSPTATTTQSTSTTSSVSIAPSPTESTGCTLHIDHWHCEGVAEGHEDEATDEVISDTGGEGCVQHGTHYHCPAGVTAPCESSLDDYDLGLHIGSLFILLVASGIGVFLPVLLGGTDVLSRKFGGVFFVLRHFGSGVIIATAFIHLLMHAFVMFDNDCLGELAYEAVAPAIAMASMMVIFIIDFVGTRRILKMRDAARLPVKGSPDCSEGKHDKHDAIGHDHDFSGMEDGGFLRDGSDKRAHWEVHLLEAGICFHSILIGVTLGAQGGSGFIPTFCAIVFHQLFEGLGLGARIGTLKFPNGGSWKRWFMCIIYTLITSTGIAIGIGVRNSFNLSGKSTILAIGVLDSMSAGILLYASVAQLLVGDWLAGDMKRAPLPKVLLGGFAMFLGLFAMSVIGKWA